MRSELQSLCGSMLCPQQRMIAESVHLAGPGEMTWGYLKGLMRCALSLDVCLWRMENYSLSTQCCHLKKNWMIFGECWTYSGN